MSETLSNNQRIAKNTLVVYTNLFLNLVIGLVSSRLVLQALGVSDYGLYSVVGGVVVLFAFVADALAGTTTRFINFESGKADGDVNRVFNVCRVLHIGMAVLLFLLLEVGGVYYIHHFLNIDPGKEGDALFVFHVTAAVWCIGVINVPYSSLFNAHERFLFQAIITLSVKLAMLGFLFWLLHFEGNRIRAYALIMSGTMMLQYLAFRLFGYHFWPKIAKWRYIKGWHYYKEALTFSGFNLMSGLSLMARGQGSALMLNYFFGTVVNGAYAIAQTLQSFLYSFSNNIGAAANPQITQSYSHGDEERVYYLISRTGKYAMFLLLLAFFPLWGEMGFVLRLWLGNVPEHTLTFSRLTLLMAFVSVTDGGIWTLVNASGKLAKFRTVYSILTLSCVPLGLVLLNAGAPAYLLLVLFLVADVLWRFIQLGMAHRILHFPVGRFCRDTYFPVVGVCVLMALCLYLTSLVSFDSDIWHVARFFLLLLLTAGLEFSVGLKENERKKVMAQAFAFRLKTH